MTRILRQNALQIVGVTVAVAMTAGLYAWTRHGSEPAASGGPGPTARATASARPTPTPDPREAAVIAAAKHYVEAVNRAYMTGGVDELQGLVEPDSIAAGEGVVGAPSVNVHHNHKTFVVVSTVYGTIDVSVLVTSAEVTVRYTLTGHDATWPALQALSTDRTLDQKKLQLSFDLVGGRWLIDAVD